jgi:hypothetical protein
MQAQFDHYPGRIHISFSALFMKAMHLLQHLIYPHCGGSMGHSTAAYEICGIADRPAHG